MSAVEIALAAGAAVIGLTGAWSPCGFSMVETIGLTGERGRRATILAACATFAPGAIVGGVITFVGLALLGGLIHGVGGDLAYLVAAAIALAAAVAEAKGARIAPQIRRQLPESWRWTMPLPVAGGLYGILLGLGFTTFVLSFGVWALAGVSFALASPAAGLAIGVAFGVGRAIPVLVLAPIVDRPFATRCTQLMADRPGLYRGFRLCDAAALVLAAVVMASTGTAGADRLEAEGGADPSADVRGFAFQQRNQSGVLREGGESTSLPGTDPAIGSRYVAVIDGGERIRLMRRGSLRRVDTVYAPGADAVAVSKNWLAYRTRRHGDDGLVARRIRGGRVGEPRSLAKASRPAQLGQPDLRKDLLVFAKATRDRNWIATRKLGQRSGGIVVGSSSAGLSNPSVRGSKVLYVRASRERQGHQSIAVPDLHQKLMLTSLHGRGRGRTLYRRGGSTVLWSTALTAKRAYVTILRGGQRRIVSVAR
jgi:hypothetical protein